MTKTPAPSAPPETRATLARRPLLGGLATAAALLGLGRRRPRAAEAVSAGAFGRGATLLVAGPDGGRLDHLSAVIAPALHRSLPPGTAIRRTAAGAADGVTGANQFAARAAPDGVSVLMVPGTAALDWLAGDARAHFDAASWVPVMAGVWPGVVAGRLSADALGRGAKVRVAAGAPVGPDLPALLAIELLGARAEPVFGFQDADAVREAWRRGTVDLVFLHGSRVAQELAEVTALGAEPLFCLGVPQPSGAFGRDPLLPKIPALPELYAQLNGAPPAGLLFSAWCALAAAAQLDFALVLPQLTPAALVALWRRAGAETADALDVRATAAAEGFRPLAGPAANASTAAVAADAEALLELRQWLASRFDWHPG